MDSEEGMKIGLSGRVKRQKEREALEARMARLENKMGWLGFYGTVQGVTNDLSMRIDALAVHMGVTLESVGPRDAYYVCKKVKS